jgi:HAD superfamily hydrolase (TIGR01509 family)
MMTKHYNSILFDFDGTLCDSWPAVYETYVETLQHFRPKADITHIAAIRTCHDYLKAFQLLFQQEEIAPQILEYANNIYQAKLAQEIVLFPTVSETLTELTRGNLAWGIVTSKKRQFLTQIIQATPLLQSASVIVCVDDITHPKPDPEGLLYACQLLQISPTKALYVGDLPTDLLAAKNSGMDSAWASYGYAEPQDILDQPQYTIAQCSELLTLTRN